MLKRSAEIERIALDLHREANANKWEADWNRDHRCSICDQTGWVCENHPTKPWDGVSARSDACTCGGAGMPCTCNPLSKDTGVTDAVSSLRHHAG